MNRQEAKNLQFVGFVCEPFEARLAEAVEGFEETQVFAGAVVVAGRWLGKDRSVELGLDVGVVGVRLFANHAEGAHDRQYGT